MNQKCLMYQASGRTEKRSPAEDAIPVNYTVTMSTLQRGITLI